MTTIPRNPGYKSLRNVGSDKDGKKYLYIQCFKIRDKEIRHCNRYDVEYLHILHNTEF